MISPPQQAPDSSPRGALIRGSILRVPLRLVRFQQPSPEQGAGARPLPIGAALPPGHVRFNSWSD